MNAVIYARYSSHNQTEQSIEGQLHDCRAYAERYGINIVGEYIDRAISGKTDLRPNFQRMISDAQKHLFDRVIVWKLDRFARNRYDSALYKHRLKQFGVRVISAMENVGEGDESILLEALLEASAEYYSLDLKKKIMRGQRESIAKGRFCGGPIPYGYKLVDGKLVADEKKAPVVRYLFEQYSSGVPMKEIIDELNRRGVRGSRGGALTYNTFSRVLTNTTYIGQYKYRGEVVPNLAEPMIDKETFDKDYALSQITDERKWCEGVERRGKHKVLLTFRACRQAMEIAREQGNLLAAPANALPEDLCFLRDGRAWFSTITHERMAFVSIESPDDAAFFLPHIKQNA